MFETPLLKTEEKFGANIGEFAGWNMPLAFTSYLEEHLAVRKEVAFFDLSHMGRLRVKGKREEMEKLICRSLNTEKGKMIGPTAFLNDNAGFVDDIMTYKVSDDEILIVTNAINREKDIKWITDNSSLNVEDLTFNYVMIAIQGKKIWDYLQKPDLEFLNFQLNTKFLDENVFLLSRSGWTGEDGIEVWATKETAEKIFEKLLNKNIKPAGLIARDSLRQEMGFVLYGEDIDDKTNPIEARYWVFDISKEFIGKEKLVEILKNGVRKIRIGFKLKKGVRTIPRNGYKLKALDTEVGYVTSSTYSPYLSRTIGMGYVNSSHALFGYSLSVVIRDKEYNVKVSDFPLI
ncbi:MULTISPECIES: glycine cleavage system aminomethyltransferase GcvT [Acidianus]|uniref:aminomethyltransferase n=1 Tax=Candidatus Acidianus copahuensis TaxID=1160895 RepID=A0A031LPG2_9CREN|nr:MULTISPECIES: glycine cleavage system aminomethyltransferase GcvT [Acidianus]EZQ06866.1 glycine cleavage system protein T [Candidatus Acidianus copahuensis]NON61368.1 glycine cleavage system aminomethyltransferase GcvT [Acidianus sp. RZ1]